MCPHDKCPDLVGKVYNLCRVKTIRIAVSAVMDGRLDLRDSLKSFVFYN